MVIGGQVRGRAGILPASEACKMHAPRASRGRFATDMLLHHDRPHPAERADCLLGGRGGCGGRGGFLSCGGFSAGLGGLNKDGDRPFQACKWRSAA